MMGKRRALGEIIASMVLLLIVSIGGGILFSMAAREGNLQSTEVKEELSFEENIIQERFKIVSFGPNSGGQLSIWILNYGDIDIVIDKIYVNDVSYGLGDFQAQLINPLPSQAGTPYESSLQIYYMDIKKIDLNALSYADACQSPGKIVISTERGVSIYGKCGP
jgi:hypothetical protein